MLHLSISYISDVSAKIKTDLNENSWHTIRVQSCKINVENSSEHLILVEMGEKYWILWLLITDVWSNHTVWDVEISSENSRRDTGLIWNIWEAGDVSRSLQLLSISSRRNSQFKEISFKFCLLHWETMCFRNQIRVNQREVSLYSDFDFISLIINALICTRSL